MEITFSTISWPEAVIFDFDGVIVDTEPLESRMDFARSPANSS